MLIEARGLAVARGGRPVLRGVSFAVGAGGALLLRGANGAGKTTLLRALAGLLPVAAGTLRIAGEDAAADPAVPAAHLAYLGHADAVKPGWTARENLALAARLARRGARAVAEALEGVGLGPLADAPAGRLSAGQRRRLAIARTVLAGRPILLLDEPATALDAASVDRLLAVLARHRAAGGAVIASIHGGLDLPDAATLVLG